MIVQVAHTGQKLDLIQHLIRAKLIRSAHVSVDDIPDLDRIGEDVYAGDKPLQKDGLTLLPPCLVFPIGIDQILSEKRTDVMSQWRPTRHFQPYWLYGVALSNMPSGAMPQGTFLPTQLTFGEAACIVAQFPLLERCRVLQHGPLRLQAYHHPSLDRMVLDNQPYRENQYHHTARLLWCGGRTYRGDHADLAYEHKQLAANPR